LLLLARSLGATEIATGHYARVRYDALSGRYCLLKGVDEAKDQSYFLFTLNQQQLAHTLFPVGEYTKDQVRQMAREFGLPVSQKPESQEICFVPNGDYVAFIEAYYRERGRALPVAAGPIVTRQGEVLGQHAGVHRFTVGQRRGLGVAVGEPLYVVATDPESGKVIVGREEELLGRELWASGVNWVSIASIDRPIRAQVRIRHKHEPAPATVEPAEDPTRVHVVFDEPQRAITPGQAAVFYDGDVVLGGGWIERAS